MPVVSTRKKYFFGEDFTQRISVRADGEFYCKLPPKAVDILGRSSAEVHADTLVNLEKEFDRLIKEAIASTESESKVILYCIALSGRVDGLPEFEEISFGNGLSISLQVGVFRRLEYMRGTTGKAAAKYEFLESSIPKGAAYGRHESLGVGYYTPEEKDGVKCIEWTEERENFFAGMVRGMEDLVKKLHKYRNPEGILGLSDKQWKLLSGS